MSKITLSFLGLTLFWLLQVNPVSIWIMSESSGLGYGSIRSTLYILGFTILTLILLFQLLSGATIRVSVLKIIFKFLCLLIIFVFLRIVIDLIKFESLDFVGVFPFIEFIFSALIFSMFDVYKFINLNINRIRIISILIMILDICWWGYSIVSGVSFGVFRANISGLEINRMADLFYAGIASFILIDKESRLIFRTIALFTILITLYRSAYLSAIAVFFYYYYQNRNHLNISSIILKFIFAIFFTSFIIVIFSGFVFKEFDLNNILIERFLSTFLSEGDVYGEVSKSDRFNQVEPLIYAFLENIFIGTGFGYYLLEEPIYNYFNYVLVASVIMGIPLIIGFFIPFAYLVRKLFLNSNKGYNSATLLINSLVIYFFILINVFPYMIYFPISSVFAFAICYHLWGRFQLDDI